MHREAKNRRNTLCISRFFNDAGRKICRQGGCGDLFSASKRNAKPRAANRRSVNAVSRPGNAKGKPGSSSLPVLEHELELGQNHVPISTPGHPVFDNFFCRTD